MKKTLLTALALCGFMAVNAQLLDVASVEEVSLPQGVTAIQAVLSPDGNLAAIRPATGGLFLLDTKTREARELSVNGSLANLSFTPDGNTVVYREASYVNNRRFVGIKAYDLNQDATTEVMAPTRNLQGFDLQGYTAVAVDNGRRQARAIQGSQAVVERPVLSINYGKLCVTVDGRTRDIAPLGDACNSYLWPTLSPDGTRICAFGVGHGAFTCALDGSDVKMLGMLRAMVWVNNDVLVGMDDIDNGVVTTASALIATDAKGQVRQTIVNADAVATFPSVSANRIGYTTPEGKFFVVNLK